MTEATDEWELPAVEVFGSADEPEEHEDVLEENEDVIAADEPETVVVAEAVISEDDADTVVPFYKREISFRRKKNAAEVVATAEFVHEVGDEDTSDAADEVEPEFVAAVDEPEETEAVVEEPMVAEQPAVAEGDAAAEFVAAEPQVGDDAPALEIVPVHELDQPGMDDGALEGCPQPTLRSTRGVQRTPRTSPPHSNPTTFEPEAVEDGADDRGFRRRGTSACRRRG